MINPAKDGVLRVLKASKNANVKRVVLTSAYGAVGMGNKNRTTPYTEKDWSNLDANLHPYQKPLPKKLLGILLKMNVEI